ncbi:MAG: hypothetical protein Q7S61_03795, partial [bacterium]|nr:hypothetical protein [bacterium]
MVKLNLLLLFFVIGFAAVILRLFTIQVLNAKALPTDYLRTQRLHPERGKILDRNEHPLALNQTTYILFA